MAEYYKGQIINVHNLKCFSYNLDIIRSYSNTFTLEISSLLKDLTEKKSLDKKTYIDNMIILLSLPKIVRESGQEIIYVKKTDENGNIYGKELVTNLVFPIKNQYSSYKISYYFGGLKQMFLEKETGIAYSYGKTSTLNNYYLYDKEFEHEHFIPHSEQYKLFDVSIDEEREIIINGKKIKLTCVMPSSFVADIEPEIIFPSNMKVDYVISREFIVNEVEVRNYLKKYDHGIGKRKRRKEYYGLLKNMVINNRLGDISFIEDNNEELVKVKKIQY